MRSSGSPLAERIKMGRLPLIIFAVLTNRNTLSLDNGPEINSSRTQFMKRLVEFADRTGLAIELVYLPPYHSKYNPVERLWGVLENHWRGELLDSVQKALGLARSMTYRGATPLVVKMVRKVYRSGATVAKKTMQAIEKKLERKEGLADWSIRIAPQASMG